MKAMYRLTMDFFAEDSTEAMNIVTGWFQGMKTPLAETQTISSICSMCRSEDCDHAAADGAGTDFVGSLRRDMPGDES